jgi:hypothetical protein
MCLPVKSEDSSSSPLTQPRSIVGLGALMVLACIGGPVIASAAGALGVGVLVGAGGTIAALALCAAVPAPTLAWRRRFQRRELTPELRDGEAPHLTVQTVISKPQRQVVIALSGAHAQFTLTIADIDEAVTSGTATATGWLPAAEASGAGHAATGAAGAAEAPFPGAVAFAGAAPST